MGHSTETEWRAGIDHELDFWRRYLASGGLDWPDDFRFRFDPDSVLQAHIAEQLPANLPVADGPILDCAAGPATTLGKTLRGERLPISAVDALADRYDEMLADLGLHPPVPSIRCEVEHLDERFEAECFALVYMRFALDHCYDPIAALRQMARVARPGGVVMIEHYRDEHENRHQGLKHWTLVPQPDDLVIRGDRQTFSIRDVLPGLPLDLDYTDAWLTLVVRKPGSGF